MITSTRRAVIESPIDQGSSERIAYRLVTTPWGSNPTNISVSIYDSKRVDYSATCLDGSPSSSGDIIITPFVHSLTKGKLYTLQIKFDISGSTVEAYVTINTEY